MNRQDIGRRIELYRERIGMSTLELAEHIGRSQATISRIENGKQGLTFELLDQIATDLRIHPFALLSDTMPRYPVIGGPNEGEEPPGGPTLLAHALYCARHHRRLGLQAAAERLNLTEDTLQAIEVGALVPDDILLTAMCTLYGLPEDVTRLAMDFDCVAPDTARGLARLQHALTRVRRLAKLVELGRERQALARILEVIDSVELAHMPPQEHPGAEFDLVLNRLAHHLATDLTDRKFRESLRKLVETAGVSAAASGTRSSKS